MTSENFSGRASGQRDSYIIASSSQILNIHVSNYSPLCSVFVHLPLRCPYLSPMCVCVCVRAALDESISECVCDYVCVYIHVSVSFYVRITVVWVLSVSFHLCVCVCVLLRFNLYEGQLSDGGWGICVNSISNFLPLPCVF